MNRIGFVLSAWLAVALVVLAPVPADAILPSLPGGMSAGAIGQYMPKDATVVVAVDVGKLVEAGVFDMVEEMGGEDAFEELKEIGIDLKKDIAQVMVGVVVDPDDPDDDPEVYIAIAGNFPSEKKFIELYKEEEGETPESRKVKGKTVYDMDEVDVCFLPGGPGLPGVILLTPTEDVEADIAKMLGGVAGSFLSSKELAPLMKDVNTKATVWVVASLPEALREAMAEDVKGAPFDISALKTVTAAFDYGNKVSLDIAMGFADEETPKALVEMFNTQIKPMGEMMAEQMPEAAKLINALEVKAAGSKTTIKMNLSREDFEAAVEGLVGMMFGAMMGGMGDEEPDW